MKGEGHARHDAVRLGALDPGLTALGFTGGHLGFSAVNKETSRRVVGREAWIGVGQESLRVAVIDTERADARQRERHTGRRRQHAWSATVTYTRPARGILTVVGPTGGHLAEVERFAVTAVRVG